jgi:hypothetical protein
VVTRTFDAAGIPQLERAGESGCAFHLWVHWRVGAFYPVRPVKGLEPLVPTYTISQKALRVFQAD